MGFSSDTFPSYLLIIDIPYANPVAGGSAPCSPIAFLDNEAAIRILEQKERQSLVHASEVRKQTISWELDSYERKLESVRKKSCATSGSHLTRGRCRNPRLFMYPLITMFKVAINDAQSTHTGGPESAACK